MFLLHSLENYFDSLCVGIVFLKKGAFMFVRPITSGSIQGWMTPTIKRLGSSFSKQDKKAAAGTTAFFVGWAGFNAWNIREHAQLLKTVGEVTDPSERQKWMQRVLWLTFVSSPG